MTAWLVTKCKHLSFSVFERGFAGKSCMYMDHKRAKGGEWQLFRDNLDASDISTACSKAQRLLLDKPWVCCSVQVLLEQGAIVPPSCKDKSNGFASTQG